jgi:hypothetical protein
MPHFDATGTHPAITPGTKGAIMGGPHEATRAGTDEAIMTGPHQAAIAGSHPSDYEWLT